MLLDSALVGWPERPDREGTPGGREWRWRRFRLHPPASHHPVVLVLDAALTVLWASGGAAALFGRVLQGRTLPVIFPEVSARTARLLQRALRTATPTYFEWSAEVDGRGCSELPPGLRIWAEPATTDGVVDRLLVTLEPADPATFRVALLLADLRRRIADEARAGGLQLAAELRREAPLWRPGSRPARRRPPLS